MGRGDNIGDGVLGPLLCPLCGTALDLDLVDARDEADGDGELLLLLDCPRNDLHATLTYGDVVSFITAEVAEKLAPSRRPSTP